MGDKKKEIVQSSAFSVEATYAGRGGNLGGARGKVKKKVLSVEEAERRFSRLHFWNVTSTSATECKT